MFRVRTDGTGYTAFSSFDDGSSRVMTPVVPGADGAVYGITVSGGAAGAGSVFKLWPPETPELSPATNRGLGQEIRLDVLGTSGESYRLLHSTDLSQWTVLSEFVMPPLGVYTYSAGAVQAAFFRAKWIPAIPRSP